MASLGKQPSPAGLALVAMDAASACLVLLLAAATVASRVSGSTPPPTSDTILPALFVFGDSSVDVGNNNYIADATFKANYLPYGKGYGRVTGRFSDGKLVVDFTAEVLGFSSSPPAYLSPEAAGQRLRYGANFASAGAGYWDETSERYNALSLTQQLEYFDEYRFKLARVAGKNATANALFGAAYILSIGNGDLVQNYYRDASLRKAYTFDGFTSLLISDLTRFVKKLYGLGARKIGITSLPPMGCFPATRNQYGRGSRGCVEWLNRDSKAFNKRQKEAVDSLAKEIPNLKIGVLDIYQPIQELVTNSSEHGFEEASKGCCGTGTIGTTISCKPTSSGLCTNSSKYVFWDGVHPTEAANAYISDSLLLEGILLLL